MLSMMSATMSDDLSVPFTVVQQIEQESVRDENKQCQWETSYKDEKLIIQMENIKLIQSPSETLSIRVEITKERDTYAGYSIFRLEGNQDMYHHGYHVEMQFPNYLHEFNQNYKYEIICKQADSHQHLFTCSMNRLSAHIKSGKQYVPLFSEDLQSLSKNIYFCIRRRLNETNDVIGNERVHRVISAFRNTGCDVVLQAKDGVIPTHKFILSQNSEVFQAMFSIEMKEKQSGIIDVSDFEKRVVNKMLDYLYTGEIGELDDMTEALFKLAHRYQLQDLCRRCEEYYIFNVKVDNSNIVEILEITDLYELENLSVCAVNFATNHAQELTTLPKYRDYLMQSINLEKVVNTLLLAEKFGLKDVRMECFVFIKDNYLDVMEREDFLNLFESDPRLMKEIHVYVHKKKL